MCLLRQCEVDSQQGLANEHEPSNHDWRIRSKVSPLLQGDASFAFRRPLTPANEENFVLGKAGDTTPVSPSSL